MDPNDGFSKLIEMQDRSRLITQPEKDLTANKVKGTFFSLKLSKSFNVLMLLRNVSEVCISFYVIYFMFHYKNGTFPDELKISRVTPLLKNGRDSDL